MKKYQTWIFTAVVVAVVAYAYFISFKGKEKDEAHKTEVSKLFTWKQADVATIKVQGKTSFDFSQTADGWKVIAPVTDLGDATSINALVTTVLDIKSEDVVAEGADIKFDLFGFGPGGRSVTVKNKAGEERAIALGTETGLGGKRFARINQEPKVHLVDSALWSQLERTVSDFRDKNLFHRVSGDVEKLHLINRAAKNKGEVTILKKDKKWQLEGSPETPLNSAGVDQFIQSLHESKASDLVDQDKTEAAAKFGLDHPLYTLEIQYVGGGSYKLEISGPVSVKPDGTKADGKTIFNYARLSDRAPLFSVGAPVTELLTKNSMDFRDRAIPFEFDSEKVESIDIKTPQSELHLKKGLNRNWLEVKENPDREVDMEQITTLFTSMKNQRVVSYSGTKTPPGFEPIQGQYLFKDKDGQTVFQLKWGKQDKTNQAPAQTSHSNEYFTVDAALINTLPAKNLVKQKSKAPPTTLPGVQSTNPVPESAHPQ